MDDVIDIERDFRRAKLGESLIYTTLHGLKPDMSTPRTVPEILDTDEIELTNELEDKKETDSDKQDSNTESESESESGDENNNTDEQNSSIHSRPRDESPNSRRLRKAAVREEKAQKRLSKTPKHVKKRAVKVAQTRKHK